jgi:hypothetical protein
MAKQGQHNNDHNDQDKSKGPNNPSKSVEVTTGSPYVAKLYTSSNKYSARYSLVLSEEFRLIA